MKYKGFYIHDKFGIYINKYEKENVAIIECSNLPYAAKVSELQDNNTFTTIFKNDEYKKLH
jgi:hypothetical protein